MSAPTALPRPRVAASPDARSVRDVTYEFLREHEMTTVFGNPGSTELHFLSGFPADFTYVLGLQEAVAVGMADGYAQASGRPTLVNLHTAPGLGHAMGAIYNASIHKAPLVVMAGQQHRSLLTSGGHLMNRDATRMPDPLVKWSYEPPRPEDVPHAIARATHVASLPPRGPTFVSVPMDDWTADADPDVWPHLPLRRIDGRPEPSVEAVERLARRLERASNPALIAGPDIDAAGGWDAAVALAERQALTVYATSVAGAGRIGFPESHPLFRGILPLSVGPIGEALAGHDLVLVFGSSVFSYFLDQPGPLLAEGTSLVQITADPSEAARAPMGDAVVADVALALRALAAEVGQATRELPPPTESPEPARVEAPMSSENVIDVLADVAPSDAISVLEASPVYSFRERMRVSKPGSFYFIGAGGLGWGLPASLGIALACPDRPVICSLGDGASQYTIQGLWTAAAYHVPVTFLVFRNDEYGILKSLGEAHGTAGMPGLELPGMEIAALARDYGIGSSQAADPEQLRVELGAAFAAPGPRLVEARVRPSEKPIT